MDENPAPKQAAKPAKRGRPARKAAKMDISSEDEHEVLAEVVTRAS